MNFLFGKAGNSTEKPSSQLGRHKLDRSVELCVWDIPKWKCYFLCVHQPELTPINWLKHMQFHMRVQRTVAAKPAVLKHGDYMEYYKYYALAVQDPTRYNVRPVEILDIINDLVKYVEQPKTTVKVTGCGPSDESSHPRPSDPTDKRTRAESVTSAVKIPEDPVASNGALKFWLKSGSLSSSKIRRHSVFSEKGESPKMVRNARKAVVPDSNDGHPVQTAESGVELEREKISVICNGAETSGNGSGILDRLRRLSGGSDESQKVSRGRSVSPKRSRRHDRSPKNRGRNKFSASSRRRDGSPRSSSEREKSPGRFSDREMLMKNGGNIGGISPSTGKATTATEKGLLERRPEAVAFSRNLSAFYGAISSGDSHGSEKSPHNDEILLGSPETPVTPVSLDEIPLPDDSFSSAFLDPLVADSDTALSSSLTPTSSISDEIPSTPPPYVCDTAPFSPAPISSISGEIPSTPPKGNSSVILLAEKSPPSASAPKSSSKCRLPFQIPLPSGKDSLFERDVFPCDTADNSRLDHSSLERTTGRRKHYIIRGNILFALAFRELNKHLLSDTSKGKPEIHDWSLLTPNQRDSWNALAKTKCDDIKSLLVARGYLNLEGVSTKDLLGKSDQEVVDEIERRILTRRTESAAAVVDFTKAHPNSGAVGLSSDVGATSDTEASGECQSESVAAVSPAISADPLLNRLSHQWQTGSTSGAAKTLFVKAADIPTVTLDPASISLPNEAPPTDALPITVHMTAQPPSHPPLPTTNLLQKSISSHHIPPPMPCHPPRIHFQPFPSHHIHHFRFPTGPPVVHACSAVPLARDPLIPFPVENAWRQRAYHGLLTAGLLPDAIPPVRSRYLAAIPMATTEAGCVELREINLPDSSPVVVDWVGNGEKRPGTPVSSAISDCVMEMRSGEVEVPVPGEISSGGRLEGPGELVAPVLVPVGDSELDQVDKTVVSCESVGEEMNLSVQPVVGGESEEGELNEENAADFGEMSPVGSGGVEGLDLPAFEFVLEESAVNRLETLENEEISPNYVDNSFEEISGPRPETPTGDAAQSDADGEAEIAGEESEDESFLDPSASGFSAMEDVSTVAYQLTASDEEDVKPYLENNPYVSKELYRSILSSPDFLHASDPQASETSLDSSKSKDEFFEVTGKDGVTLCFGRAAVRTCYTPSGQKFRCLTCASIRSRESAIQEHVVCHLMVTASLAKESGFFPAFSSPTPAAGSAAGPSRDSLLVVGEEEEEGEDSDSGDSFDEFLERVEPDEEADQGYSDERDVAVEQPEEVSESAALSSAPEISADIVPPETADLLLSNLQKMVSANGRASTSTDSTEISQLTSNHTGYEYYRAVVFPKVNAKSPTRGGKGASLTAWQKLSTGEKRRYQDCADRIQVVRAELMQKNGLVYLVDPMPREVTRQVSSEIRRRNRAERKKRSEEAGDVSDSSATAGEIDEPDVGRRTRSQAWEEAEKGHDEKKHQIAADPSVAGEQPVESSISGATDVAIRRGPGRPRGSRKGRRQRSRTSSRRPTTPTVIEVDLSTAAASTSSDRSIRRGRGRPPKPTKILANSDLPSHDPLVSPVSRGRGRPTGSKNRLPTAAWRSGKLPIDAISRGIKVKQEPSGH